MFTFKKTRENQGKDSIKKDFLLLLIGGGNVDGAVAII
jgi:hypothetical protein